MSNHGGVGYISEKIEQTLVDYIETEYLGKTPELLAACAKALRSRGTIFQDPYFEATPEYGQVKDGIRTADLPDGAKSFLLDMAESGRGVFPSPYQHQIQALEAFWAGKDVLVSTGTGSGKTECFMWPLASKLAFEAQSSPESWKNYRAVRALVMYPMNALVTDQVGRLRKMMGVSTREGKSSFLDIWKKGERGRRPQFGMYTGRTPYPGRSMVDNESKNREYARSIRNDLLSLDENDTQKLRDVGRYPEKADLSAYVSKVEESDPGWSPDDAELLNRFEMRAHTPDVLITNFSMLQLMLVRQVERGIWSSTAAWLRDNPDQKMLVVLDEAHMYKGSPGGEVALLLRRLAHRLGVGSDRFQFILTSASIPEDNRPVRKFFQDMTGKKSCEAELVLVRGPRPVPPDLSGCIEVEPTVLLSVDIAELVSGEEGVTSCASKLAMVIGTKGPRSTIDCPTWLGETLCGWAPFRRLSAKVRSGASTISELAQAAFPGGSAEAEEATDILINLAAKATDASGKPLIPIRMHMFVRGIQSLVACCNPDCPDHTFESDPFGWVGVNKTVGRCPSCGCATYSLTTDRSCGAAFLKGYVRSMDGDFWFWNSSLPDDDSFRETALYILPQNHRKLGKKLRTGWLDPKTGRVTQGLPKEGPAGLVEVAFQTEMREDEECPFTSCPKCGGSPWYTDFVLKGNPPFFNLVKTQFDLQEKSGNPELLQWNPNAGKKVILFSDSRQSAAQLALDLSDASDRRLFRDVAIVAAKKLQDDSPEEQSIASLYCSVAHLMRDEDIRMFDAKTLEDIRAVADKLARRRNRYYDVRLAGTIPLPYKMKVLDLLSDPYRSFTDIAVAWLSPTQYALEDALEGPLAGKGVSEEDFLAIFQAWITHAVITRTSLDPTISIERRRSVSVDRGRYGIELENIYDGIKSLQKLVEAKFGDEALEAVTEALTGFLQKPADEPSSQFGFVDTDSIRLQVDPDREWLVCPHCSKVSPYSLWGKCISCGEEGVRPLVKGDFNRFSFWRSRCLALLENPSEIDRSHINTEEHTAQLSHKDQGQDTWSTTELFEMLFQDICVGEKKPPVDIISCTTTMEVGVDIGSLTAVGLRNVPPMRENYQQRAGRAGRRGASVSTILTYIEGKPFDNSYFDDPTRLVRGHLREPGVDVDNMKLIFRHLATVAFTQYGDVIGASAEDIKIDVFLKSLKEDFARWLSGFSLGEEEYCTLVPQRMAVSLPDFKTWLFDQIADIERDFLAHPETFLAVGCDNEYISLLDSLLRVSAMPTYSFPRNVVGFHIEDPSNPRKLLEMPSRSIDLAISDYAPGRRLIVNKKTYIAGGIYSHESKFGKGSRAPARAYFDSASHTPTLFRCADSSCGWIGMAKDLANETACPFCGSEGLEETTMLVPWGFSPRQSVRLPTGREREKMSWACPPVYSVVPKSEEMTDTGMAHIRFSHRPDCSLVVVNNGPERDGFDVCSKCGAALPHSATEAEKREILSPFLDNNTKRPPKCSHDWQEVVLGSPFKSDMLLIELGISMREVSTPQNGGNSWFLRASTSLAEAVRLSAVDILDVDFSELNVGCNRIYGRDNAKCDIYLFDSLSSGAGYSAMLSSEKSVRTVLERARELLDGCDCEASCGSCLQHFQNKRLHGVLDRKAGLELLDYAVHGTIAAPIEEEEARRCFEPLMAAVKRAFPDSGFEFDGPTLSIRIGGAIKTIEIVPDMWQATHGQVRKFEVTHAVPDLFERIVFSTKGR